MIINKESNYLTALLKTKSIAIEYKRENEIKNFLNGIDLHLSWEPLFTEGKVSLRVRPISKDIVVDKLPPDKIFDEVRDKSKESVSILDFESSDEFYDYFRSDKSGSPKIVSDDFSVERAKAMYGFIARIELGLRSSIEEQSDIKLLPKNFRRNLPDNKIAQIDLTEYLEKILLEKASDEFYLKYALGAESHDALIAARHMTIIQEKQLPFSEKEFRHFINIRNAVMHFRVVTYKDCLDLLGFYGKFEQYSLSKLWLM